MFYIKFFINKNDNNLFNLIVYNVNKIIMNSLNIKNVFKPFLSDENAKANFLNTNAIYKKKNQFKKIFKSKKKEILTLFDVKKTVFKQIRIKPLALKKFEKGLKNYFFGKDGIITQKCPLLQNIYKQNRNSIDFKLKINLSKNEFLNDKNNIHMKYILQRSSNFSLDENNNNNNNYYQPKKSYFSLNKNPKNNLILQKNKSENDFFSYSMKNKMNNNNNNNPKTNSLILFSKNSFNKINSNLFNSSNIKSRNKQINKDIKKIFKTTDCFDYLNSEELENKKKLIKLKIKKEENLKKEINKTKKILSYNLSYLDKPYKKNTTKLCNIIDNATIVFKSPKKEKIKKEYEIIFDKKLKSKKKIKMKNFLKQMENINDEDEIKKLTENLNKYNEKFQTDLIDKIIKKFPKYYKKRKIHLSPDINFKHIKLNKMQIYRRNILNNNYNKLNKMSFSLDLHKRKIGLI